MKLFSTSMIIFVIFMLTSDYTFARLNVPLYRSSNSSMTKESQKKYDKLRMTAGSMEKMKNLHKNTYYQALKAIIGKLGSMLFKELSKSERNRLLHCLDHIEDRRDMYEAAICVTRARKRHVRATTTSRNPLSNGDWRSFLRNFDDTGRLHSNVAPNQHHDDRLMSLPHPVAFESQYLQPTNKQQSAKPTSTDKKSDKLLCQKTSVNKNFQQLLPLRKNNAVNSARSQNLAALFNKKHDCPKCIHRIKRDYRLFTTYRNIKTSKKPKKLKILQRNVFDKLAVKSNDTIVKKVVTLIKEFAPLTKGQQLKTQWSTTFDRLMRVRRTINEQKAYPGGKIYEKRMYDLVADSDEATLTPSERKSTGGIMHDAMKLLFKMTNSNSSDNGSETYRVFSPRFMPLMPLNEGRKDLRAMMSPNIMALYDDGNVKSGQNVGNIPNLMKLVGLTTNDRDQIMQLLMDVSGTSVHIDEAIGLYEKLGMFDDDIAAPLMKSTERILGSFKLFEKSLFPNQKENYNSKGFTFVKRHQIEKLLKDQGVDKNDVDLEDLDIYNNMSDAEMEEALWRTVEFIATNKTHLLEPNEHARRKRNLITVGNAIVLSPYMFAFQVGAVVLGPVILSPNIFCPPVLNPSVLAPWVLTPSMFNPFILSPYIFGPFILGPFAFTSFILTPYFLSPNVVNPYLFTSLVLSPLGLCPDILSPVAVGANVLSPTFLSPPVLNPTVLTASVLSPSWLS